MIGGHDSALQWRPAWGLQVGELSSLDPSVCPRPLAGLDCSAVQGGRATFVSLPRCRLARRGVYRRERVRAREGVDVWCVVGRAGWVTWPAAPLTSRLTITYLQPLIPEYSTNPSVGGRRDQNQACRMSPLLSRTELAYHHVNWFLDAHSQDRRPRRTTGLLAARGWGVSLAPGLLSGRHRPHVGGLSHSVMAASVPRTRCLAMEGVKGGGGGNGSPHDCQFRCAEPFLVPPGVPPPSPHCSLFDSARSRPSSDEELIHPLPIMHVCPCPCQWYE